ncbi:ABC transporter permease [Dyella nitratireducens]|uniref:ABC transporter permease n=1 Tax=Dyella nitratireducens TaxID=1849580 RepID=A0ABQ1FNG7_9GAMM|nr:FtsX-like permease family protein [Dyella nitratireducens]GGA22705.1 ABC transporter permease [Dyella nitratireducens]GLQ44075.1 ABC transporter permease [Dyella nitratireducens]
MQIKPILAAMRRHKAGTILIGFQIALTLAIVCNALFIIHGRMARVSRPSGVNETNLFVISNVWAGNLSDHETAVQIQADLDALLQLGSVEDATALNSFPLHGSGWDNIIRMKPDQIHMTTDSSIYLSDDHTLNTLGVKLIAGRNFTANEVQALSIQTMASWPVIIVSKDLATLLFPKGDALGKQIYATNNNTPSTIIGISDTLQSHMMDSDDNAFAYNAVLVPMREVGSGYIHYLIRARPGQLAAAMREAPKALIAQNRMRIFYANDGEVTFAKVRAKAYERDYGMAVLLVIVSAVLLAITAAGIVGLTSFWVGQRRRQIGVRRALGATQGDILSYFMTENLLIAVGGIVVGTLLAIGINLWMVTHYGVAYLSGSYLLVAAIALLLLGQGAVFAPALRASRVSPIEATRTA